MPVSPSGFSKPVGAEPLIYVRACGDYMQKRGYPMLHTKDNPTHYHLSGVFLSRLTDKLTSIKRRSLPLLVADLSFILFNR